MDGLQTDYWQQNINRLILPDFSLKNVFEDLNQQS